ncbi:MAG: hypothetical protein JXD22_07170 [Sedimentisphaerales bacterium]|nr:hypothetical protein [Sedimentisphaerales bacterium]
MLKWCVMSNKAKHEQGEKVRREQENFVCSEPDRLSQGKCACDLLDKALALMIEREESLINETLAQSNSLLRTVDVQVEEIVEYLEKTTD